MSVFEELFEQENTNIERRTALEEQQQKAEKERLKAERARKMIHKKE